MKPGEYIMRNHRKATVVNIIDDRAYGYHENGVNMIQSGEWTLDGFYYTNDGNEHPYDITGEYPND